jgi:hypothetical protein
MKTPLPGSFTIIAWTFLLIFCIGLLHSSAQRAPRSQPTMTSLVNTDETMVYSVHYGFLTLGEVILEHVRDTVYQGKKAYYSRTIIRSNPSIPFVGRKERHFHSIFAYNDTIAYGLNFWTDSIHDNEYMDSRYIFDYDKGKVFIYEFEVPTDTLDLDGPADSGPTLHLITRLYAGLNAKRTYPIYISNEKGNVEMTYTSKVEQVSSEAFGGNVSAYYSFGNANVKGPFGFSGAYKAWHMTNDSRIPLEAHVRVWVGNVRVKLKSYTKK